MGIQKSQAILKYCRLNKRFIFLTSHLKYIYTDCIIIHIVITRMGVKGYSSRTIFKHGTIFELEWDSPSLHPPVSTPVLV